MIPRSRLPQSPPSRFLHNALANREAPYPPPLESILSLRAHEAAFGEISSWQEYEPTPLLSLDGLAEALDIGRIWYKDEGQRFGLGSFKALGGMYGVLQVLRSHLERKKAGPVTSTDLLEGHYRKEVSDLTVTCASASNHGRAVAAGAKMFGCRCVVFLPSTTHPTRATGIARLGADTRRVQGSYDDAVRLAARTADEAGWLLVSDTAYPGYEAVPCHVMQGYTVMVREVLERIPVGDRPTHVFLQAGVGGLAAAVCSHLWESLGPSRPTMVVVEPEEADCLLESAFTGRIAPARGSLGTAMSCLACRHPSTLAWKILERGADAFLSISDYCVADTVRALAEGVAEDPPVRTQPSGAAGVAGLIAAVSEPAVAAPLALNDKCRVLLFGTEGPL